LHEQIRDAVRCHFDEGEPMQAPLRARWVEGLRQGNQDDGMMSKARRLCAR
jgi:hypothetical protein